MNGTVPRYLVHFFCFGKEWYFLVFFMVNNRTSAYYYSLSLSYLPGIIRNMMFELREINLDDLLLLIGSHHAVRYQVFISNKGIFFIIRAKNMKMN